MQIELEISRRHLQIMWRLGITANQFSVIAARLHLRPRPNRSTEEPSDGKRRINYNHDEYSVAARGAASEESIFRAAGLATGEYVSAIEWMQLCGSRALPKKWPRSAVSHKK